MGRQYFVSVHGNDSNDGTSPALAWQTLDRAGTQAFEAGDNLYLQGGQTFQGPLLLQGVESNSTPITITSYGEGIAQIDGGRGSAVLFKDCDGIQVSRLKCFGAGRKTGNEHGVGVHVIHSRNVTIDQVDVSGFQYAGVGVEGSAQVRITRVHAHENGFAGITTFGDVNRDIYIGYSRAINNPGDPTITDNHSGNGICLYRVTGALVEYCEAAENGWDMQQSNWNGPVGIWTAVGADHVVIQFCVAHHNRSTKGDGGGFDFDGGTTNCLMQYNYSYRNGGCGYLLCQYEGGALWKNNVVRYCISEDDGLTDHRAGFFTYMGELLYNCQVYHNVVVNSDGRNCVHGAPVGSKWFNNLFLLRGNGEFIHNLEDETATFQGNGYFRLDGRTNMSGFSSLADWRQATGQETMNGLPVGLQVDPKITLPDGAAVRPTNPEELKNMPWFRLGDDSPLACAGLNLLQLFGIDVGTGDFFGKPLHGDGECSSIGAYQV